MKQYTSLLLLALGMSQPSISQKHTTVNTEIVSTNDSETRANELTHQLNLADASKRQQVQTLLTDHLKALQVIFDDRRKKMQDAGQTANKELADSRARTAWDAANGQLNKLYAAFLGKLSILLTPEQTEKLKDLMTEGGLQREYNHYLALLPNLSEQQKSQVIAYLKEARENAMNAATAQNRAKWFIKFRGRANNYLAAAGYDLRKATEELEARKNKNQ
ncbi:DUF3826 domain-containing protein [Niabella yanshanensis]|uniref:DUF3826 domain-containing protein n=1 Tax=Niabella yanshanensis TaxID=577386 RepID=A0ABZ0WCB2_9BACT|nr:DUF3826 domain-containing protein [Niabella yanshanensis]WQD39407.1 DUF3826 domain-containing protein [Niabella yanshanensis]